MKRYISIKEGGERRDNGEHWSLGKGMYAGKSGDKIDYFDTSEEAIYYAKNGHTMTGEEAEDEDEKPKKKGKGRDPWAYSSDEVEEEDKASIVKYGKGFGMFQNEETGEWFGRPDPKDGGHKKWLKFDDEDDAKDYSSGAEKPSKGKGSADMNVVRKPEEVDELKGKEFGLIKGKDMFDDTIYYAKPNNKDSKWREFETEKEAQAYIDKVPEPKKA
jgi:hypothetical protein